jgi:hypothetical protein
MIGLLIAIVIFNFIAFKSNKRLTMNQIVHIWTFTIAFQAVFDVFIEFKYHAYWYFEKEIDWAGLMPHLFLVPAANLIFLNFYPFNTNRIKQAIFILFFTVVILLYEMVTLLPKPWGYFHYGWWELWHAAMLDPILLLILLGYYKWILKIERKACLQSNKKDEAK